MQKNYKAIITSARAAARDILRSRKVSDLLGWISGQNKIIKDVTEGRAAIVKRHEKEEERAQKELARAKHIFQVAEATNDPDVETAKEVYEASQKAFDRFEEAKVVPNTRELEDYDARGAQVVKAAEEKIAEYNEKIANWDNGTSKVCRDEMIALANTLVAGRVTTAFNEGEYDGETDDEASA